ncbi:LysE family transporter [Streptomyces sp. NPDC101132]|uniref:LysE family transporter n=1 Tax=Streptomyces sp. NPDC101132 TaxID=3366110 RepID=UPI0038064D81
MSGLWTTAVAGAAAGLGVAMPVGAMGVLLLQESMRGRRGAVAAAAAVAVVDLAYAALATALGPLVSAALSDVEAWVRLLSAAVLLTIAAHGLWTSRNATAGGGATDSGPAGGAAGVPDSGPAGAAVGVPGSGPAAAGGPGSEPGGAAARGPDSGPAAAAQPAAASAPAPGPSAAGPSPARTFLRFAALTAINPTTALYFAALTTAQGDELARGTAGAVFVAAVFGASLLWQQLLVLAGSFAGSRISDTARAWTFRIGYGLVAVYAVKIALPLP